MAGDIGVPAPMGLKPGDRLAAPALAQRGLAPVFRQVVGVVTALAHLPVVVPVPAVVTAVDQRVFGAPGLAAFIADLALREPPVGRCAATGNLPDLPSTREDAQP